MSKQLKTLMEAHVNEIVIDRSEFITYLFPTETEEEAFAAIESVRKKHHDATHNCTAYILGIPIDAQKTNDDGEPKGTAGIPMLTSLNYQEMTNITAVVTRYFGGIKLGAGGLIRAYSSSVTDALAGAQLATYETLQTYQFEINYDEINSLYHLRDTTDLFTLLDTKYDANILITIETLAKNVSELQKLFIAHLMREVDFIFISEIDKKFPYTKIEQD